MKKMKVLICAMLFLLSSRMVNAKETIIVRENKGPNGYKYVTEIRNQHTDVLTCKEPGYSSCMWTLDTGHGLTIIGNGINYLADELVAYVDKQLDQGDSSGTTVFSGQVLVVWETTEFGTTIRILNGNDFPQHLK